MPLTPARTWQAIRAASGSNYVKTR
jgi:hypothetical protein